MPPPDPPPPWLPPLRRLAAKVAAARHVVVLTGAGISAESGLATFRGNERDMASLWKSFDPASLATPEAFHRDPETVTRWYDWRRLGCLAAQPNPGHTALAALEHHLERAGGSLTILTQNVDRLHHRAGSRNVVELHGDILNWRCTVTGRTLTPPDQAFERFPMPSPFHPHGLLRPNVVWFGEPLPEEALQAAFQAANQADVFMSVGTSAVVQPAAGFLQVAAAAGAFTTEINPQATPLTSTVDAALAAPAGVILPALMAQLAPH